MQADPDGSARGFLSQLPRFEGADVAALIRAEFGGLRGVYLDMAARGPLPASARQAAEEILRAQAEGGVQKDKWLKLVEDVRVQVAALIGACAEEIAFTKNTSEGLNIVAAGLRLGRGDRIIVAPAAEHPNNVFPWLWQARERGAEVVSVVVPPHESLESGIIRHIGADTKLVAVTAVDFGTGRRTDLTVIGDACRAHGAFLLVDAAQSAGVLAEDMARMPVDGWATAVQKGLLGLYGLGLLYVRKEWVEHLRPVSLARFSVTLGAGHEAAGPEAGWRLREGAGRYEVGNYNYIALAALQASLSLLSRIGRDDVERRAMVAAVRLRSTLERLDVPLLDVPAAHRSHIVAIAERQSDGHDRSDVDWVNRLSAALTSDGVAHSVRRGAVRLATHVYVTDEMVGRVIGTLETWRRTWR